MLGESKTLARGFAMAPHRLRALVVAAVVVAAVVVVVVVCVCVCVICIQILM